MTWTPTIYDWRRSLCPLDQSFRAGGLAIGGGMTLGGASVLHPEPGGRAELTMTFPQIFRPEHAADASWTASRIMNGTVWRIPLYGSVQLVSAADLDVPDTGQTWANGAAWANDENWRANPFAYVTAAASKGAASFAVDMSILGDVLKIGHVIGFHLDGYDFAHMVMDIDYVDGVATVTVEPPLRRAMAIDDYLLFRPVMTATCANGAEVLNAVRARRAVSFNGIRFVEALV